MADSGKERAAGKRRKEEGREKRGARRKDGSAAEAGGTCGCGPSICRIAGKSIPGGGKDLALSGSRGAARLEKRGACPATALRNDISRKQLFLL